MADGSAMRRMCGQLVIGGFEGTEPPASFLRAMAAGERGGAILFARNLTRDPMQCAELSCAIAKAAPAELPPLVSIDQEGGRVARLKAPILELPPMRAFGDFGDEGLAHDAAEALARQLAALGVTMNFAPVLDVNTRAANPVIGDRAFGDDAGVVSRMGLAWARGLRAGGVLACGKHYPGHGDTTKDSHFDLPIVERVDATVGIDLAPFRDASHARIAALMTAHVLYPKLDAEYPATLSPTALGLARARLDFQGCLISDDLEMKAVADRWSIEESAVRAIDAGCDALLICRSEDLQGRAVDALAKRATEDPRFEARAREAHTRFVAMRRGVTPRPVATRGEFDAASAMAEEMGVRVARALAAGTLT